jgi:hypothetical protein
MIQLKLYVSVGQANGYHGNAPNESGRIGQAAIFYFFIFFPYDFKPIYHVVLSEAQNIN